MMGQNLCFLQQERVTPQSRLTGERSAASPSEQPASLLTAALPFIPVERALGCGPALHLILAYLPCSEHRDALLVLARRGGARPSIKAILRDQREQRRRLLPDRLRKFCMKSSTDYLRCKSVKDEGFFQVRDSSRYPVWHPQSDEEKLDPCLVFRATPSAAVLVGFRRIKHEVELVKVPWSVFLFTDPNVKVWGEFHSPGCSDYHAFFLRGNWIADLRENARHFEYYSDDEKRKKDWRCYVEMKLSLKLLVERIPQLGAVVSCKLT